MPQKHQALTVTRLDHQGAGISYQGRHPIFIEGALVGEDVLVQVTEKKSKYSRANLIRVLKPSPARQTPLCPHYSICGGCHLQHMAHDEQLVYKEQALHGLMEKIAGDSINLSSSIHEQGLGYRRRVRFSLRWQEKQRHLTFGFRQRQSQRIVDIDTCPVLAPSLEQLIQPLKSLLRALHHPAHLGHVEMVMSDAGAVVVLRHMKPLSVEDLKLIEGFQSYHQLTFYLAGNEQRRTLSVQKTYSLIQKLVCLWHFNPITLFRSILPLTKKWLRSALDWLALSPQDRVLDLFCGVGNFSLPLAKRVRAVVGVEGVDEMVVQAQQNAQQNHITNACFYQANLEESMIHEPWADEQFDKILLDPARAGAKGIIEVLGQFGARKVVYVSCDPATMARDARILFAQGYQLEKLAMLDMFPQTHHFESMALFGRYSSSSDDPVRIGKSDRQK